MQVQRAVNRAGNTVFGLSAAAATVLLFGLAAVATMVEGDAPAILLALTALITVTALLLGLAALVSVHHARLLLAWRQQHQQCAPARTPEPGADPSLRSKRSRSNDDNVLVCDTSEAWQGVRTGPWCPAAARSLLSPTVRPPPW